MSVGTPGKPGVSHWDGSSLSLTPKPRSPCSALWLLPLVAGLSGSALIGTSWGGEGQKYLKNKCKTRSRP